MKLPFTIYAMYGSPDDEDDKPDPSFPTPIVRHLPNKTALLEIIGPQEFADYLQIRNLVESIRESKQYEQVVIYMNCPGGVVSGAMETADAISKLNRVKPVTCIAEHVCASAGYMFAAQCKELIVSPTCLVGSVGVRMVIVDDSALHKSLGLRVIPVATGADKCLLTPGVPVDDDAIAKIFDHVNSFQRQFILTLKQSPFLNASKILDLARDASVWHGDDAVRYGFATRLASFDEWQGEAALKKVDAAVAARAEIESLKGEAAVNKYYELAEQLNGGSLYKCEMHHSKIASKYPKLAAAALRANEDLAEEVERCASA